MRCFLLCGGGSYRFPAINTFAGMNELRHDQSDGARFKLKYEANSWTHKDSRIKALVGIKCTGGSEDSDWMEIMSTLRYYRRLGQTYAQWRNLGNIMCSNISSIYAQWGNLGPMYAQRHTLGSLLRISPCYMRSLKLRPNICALTKFRSNICKEKQSR